MKQYDLNELIDNPELVEQKIKEFLENSVIKIEKLNKEEIEGHLLKSKHNLNFVKDCIRLNYYDWAITGCYYACYHVALALILTKGYSSKSHLATLCVLIKEFYKKELNKEDIELLSNFLNYQDVLFYVESKNKRENATYSTKTKFEKKDVEQLRIKATMFVSKINSIINN